MILIIITHFIIIIIYYTKKLYVKIQNIIRKISFNYDKFELLKLSTKKNKFKLCFNKTKSRRKSKNKAKLKKDKESNPPIKKSRKINKNLKCQIDGTTQSFKKFSYLKICLNL